jgi:hypothetical protein
MIKEKMSKTIMEIGSITETFSVIIQMYIKSSSIFPWKARKPKMPGVPKCGIFPQVAYSQIPVHLTLSTEGALTTVCSETNVLLWGYYTEIEVHLTYKREKTSTTGSSDTWYPFIAMYLIYCTK